MGGSKQRSIRFSSICNQLMGIPGVRSRSPNPGRNAQRFWNVPERHPDYLQETWPPAETRSVSATCRAAARLVLDIRLAVGGWRSASSDDARDHDDRDQVGGHREKLGRNRRSEDAELLLQG